MGRCIFFASLAFLLINYKEIFSQTTNKVLLGTEKETTEKKQGKQDEKILNRSQFDPFDIMEMFGLVPKTPPEDDDEASEKTPGKQKKKPGRRQFGHSEFLEDKYLTSGEGNPPWMNIHKQITVTPPTPPPKNKDVYINRYWLSSYAAAELDRAIKAGTKAEWIEYHREKTEMANRLEMENIHKVQHFPGEAGEGTARTITSKVCYYIGTTYLNAIQDLREYYPIRYLYQNTQEYEIGYVIGEIVYKYTVVLELFHTVQYRFENRSGYQSMAPPTYMIYMYITILQQCQQIIHLCNTLGEIEPKYTKHLVRTVFDNPDTSDVVSLGGDEREIQLAQANEAMLQFMKAQKRYRRERRKRLQQQRKDDKKLMQLGLFSTTTRSLRPKSYPYFPHHYGWSIEIF